MANSTLPSGAQTCVENPLELHGDLERMIEYMENISAHLSLMAHEMAALRTSPECWGSMLLLEEAHRKCSNAVGGSRLLEPAPTDTPHTRM